MDGYPAIDRTACQRTSSFSVTAAHQGDRWLQWVSASLPDVIIACDRSGTIRYESIKAAEARAAGTLPPLKMLLRKCLPGSLKTDQHVDDSVPGLVDRILRSPGIDQGCSGRLLIRNSGGLAFSEVSAHVLRDSFGGTIGLLVKIDLPVANWNAVRRLIHEARHDVLTDLPNRRQLYERLNRLIAQRDPAAHHALLMMDLDSFKQVNDQCGHQAGDDALRHVAALLKSEVRSRDTLARLGGDEFCLLMEHCSTEMAAQTAQKLMAAVRKFTFVRGDRVFRFGLSVGVTALSEHHVAPTCVLAEADAACYQVKRRGGHGVAVAQPGARETKL
jgi:diguanylate cyclase (GGDEF)-like protein